MVMETAWYVLTFDLVILVSQTRKAGARSRARENTTSQELGA